MSENTKHLHLPYLAAAQAQKHVTHNEALRSIDSLLHLSVIDDTMQSSPANPQDGDRYIVATGASGDWSGEEGKVASREDGAWTFHTPQTGWVCHRQTDGALLIFSGTSWNALQTGGSGDSSSGGALFGINTTADLTNRFAVASQASLFNHEGTSHRLTINKAAVTDSASVLFQSGFSGRAEMSVGSGDDFRLRVSSDGSTWADALVVDHTDGSISFPSGGVRELLSAPRTYHVAVSGGSNLNSGASSSSAFATLERAVSQIESLDGGGNAVVVQLGSGTHSLTNTLRFANRIPGVTEIRIVGDAANPASVRLESTAYRMIQSSQMRVVLSGLTFGSTGGGSFLVSTDQGMIVIDNVIFEANSEFHVDVNGGQLELEGNYTITGGALRHINLGLQAKCLAANRTVTLSNNPSFSLEFIRVVEGSVAQLWMTDFVGGATGRRHAVDSNGVVNSYGKSASYFPGSTAGIVATGGQFQ